MIPELMSKTKKPKSILIVTTAFAPENAIGAVRLSKLAKYLVRAGHSVTVISPALDATTRLDLSLECPEFDSLSRHVVPQSEIFDRLFARRRRNLLSTTSASSLLKPEASANRQRVLKAWLFRYVQWTYNILRSFDWRIQVVRFVDEHLSGQRFDVVVSSYPSLGAMWSAKRLRQAAKAKRWVADFRDPIDNTLVDPPLRFLNSRIQRDILNAADHVVGVSEGVIGGFSPDFRAKCSLLTGGFDPDDATHLPSRTEPHKFALRLSYAGSLYGGERNLVAVFRALRQLVDQAVVCVDDLRFEYAGKEFGVLLRQAARAGMEPILVDRGYVDRTASMCMQRDSDLVVVGTWNTQEAQGVMPGKLFECFLMRKQVLGVVNGNRARSEMKEVVERIGGGFVYEEAAASPEGEFTRLCEFLRNQIEHRYATRGVASSYNSGVEEFAYPRIVGRLESLL